ncbi:MAG TPA: Holliday junction resolvase RecU [Bacillus sp. (in: firmicutes)]|uniref:Holliday junction resolvase RecU n=1 Tax=Bacillus litorisediminis TaxID=2922713 RepID=UPI001FAFECCF|nr:Holliday junction resolvase RecU [Bacillus litorisediminis]HWO76358.1 Holliday junction resolvase RecU [Bacillus sp. (in: firmicutes)]
MNIRYPNGKRYTVPHINHKETSPIEYGKRGMTLEEDLNATNEYYRQSGIAVIHKKPTPIQIVQVDYPKRSSAVIKEAYFRQPSTTDYNGVYKGRYIDFEAKETNNKTSFPLKNVHEHQIEHMRAVIQQQGITFIIIRFGLTDELFLLEGIHLLSFWHRMANGGRKSISKEELKKVGHSISIGFQPRIDYIKIIDRFLLT